MRCTRNTIIAVITADYMIDQKFEDPAYDTPEQFEVEPDAHEDKRLATAHKYLTKDILVKKIFTSDVSNLSGGTTTYIASKPEVEGA